LAGWLLAGAASSFGAAVGLAVLAPEPQDFPDGFTGLIVGAWMLGLLLGAAGLLFAAGGLIHRERERRSR
jgi:hypothetical protein